MMELKKMLDNSKHTEVHSAAIRIIREYKDCNITDDKFLTNTIEFLTETSANLSRTIKRPKTKSDLKLNNNLRDEKYKSIHYILIGFIESPIEEFANNAKMVYSTYKSYGLKVLRRGYSDKSALINSLLTDLKKDNLQKAIKVLPGLKQRISELQEAQKTFEAERLNFEKKNAKELTLPTATVIKDEVKKIINKDLIVYLRAMYVTDEDKYGTLAKTVAKIIDDNNMEVKRRSKKNGDREEVAENKVAE